MSNKIAFLRLCKELEQMKTAILSEIQRSGADISPNMTIDALKNYLGPQKPDIEELRMYFPVIYRKGKYTVRGKPIENLTYNDL
jgi:hypothetical protein